MRCRACGLEEPVVYVGAHVDVDLLGDPDGGVAHEPGHVLDADVGLAECPGGEHMTERVERPVPTVAVGVLGPSDELAGRVPEVTPVVGPSGPAAPGRRKQ